MKSLPISWVDLTVAVILIVGIFRGRKHGISEELLPLLRALLIVGIAGYFYAPVGSMIANGSVFSTLSCYVGAYLGLALLIYIIFHLIKKAVGDKLIGSDLFGTTEYYLGMVAGVIRFACVILIALAIIHARAYTPAERAANAKMQQDNFGDISFPTFATIQQDVFAISFTGRYAEEFGSLLLIRSTLPQDKSLRDSKTDLRREGQLNDVLGGSNK
jgi:uncharacterized membrane protein required for colicin V production